MLILDGATDLLRVVTASGGAAIKCHVSWVKNVSGTLTPDETNTASIATATTTTICAGVSSSQISVRHVNIRNDHASAADTITVTLDDGSIVAPLFKVTLAAGETLILGENGVWVYYDANGKPYMGLGPLATQADMEAGTSATVIVTPSVVQYHPSACKFWVKTQPGGVNSASYNVTSVSDAAAGITVITIATDFSSANWCCQATCESTSDTMTVTNLKFVRVGLADQAAGTVSIEVHDGTAITAVLEDPTSWYACGYGDQ